jgi:hypothetical protein
LLGEVAAGKVARDDRTRLIVALSPDEFRRLERWGQVEERAVDQQATWVLRRALEQLQVIEASKALALAAGGGER